MPKKQEVVYNYLHLKEKIPFDVYIQGEKVADKFSGEEISAMNKMAKFLKQKRKNQHYVPQGYLRNFTDTDGLLHTLDLKNKRMCNKRSPGGVCYKEYFYAKQEGKYDLMSQLVEFLLCEHEDAFFKKYPGIINNILSQDKVTEETLEELCQFCGTQWIRTKAYRKDIKERNDELDEEILKRYPDSFIPRHNDAGVHIGLLMGELGHGSFGHAFQNKRITFFYLQEGSEYKFVASDNPFFTISNWKGNLYGNSIFDRTDYFFLHPRIIIEFSPYKSGKKVKRKLITSKHDIFFYNLLLSCQSDFLYSNHKRNLEEENYSEARIVNIEQLFEKLGPESVFKKDFDFIKLREKELGRKLSSTERVSILKNVMDLNTWFRSNT